MEPASLAVRAAFVQASEFVLAAFDAVGEQDWDRPGLGEWTVRELAVHTSRAWSTIIDYVAVPAELALRSATDYYRAALGGDPAIHEQVSRRARAQAEALEEPLPAVAHRLFREAENVLERTPADHVLGTFAGGIRLVDYLPTRVVELVVHGIDLCIAVGRPVEVPTPALELTLEVLVDLASERPERVDPVHLVRALTGRAPLPGDYDVLG
jgi:uncharacterized protein (TIGR03083 family)